MVDGASTLGGATRDAVSEGRRETLHDRKTPLEGGDKDVG